MVFTEEDKAFIKVLYMIIGYGLRKLMRHFPGKLRKRSRLENLITKLLKKQMSKRKHNTAITRTMRGPN